MWERTVSTRHPYIAQSITIQLNSKMTSSFPAKVAICIALTKYKDGTYNYNRNSDKIDKINPGISTLECSVTKLPTQTCMFLSYFIFFQCWFCDILRFHSLPRPDRPSMQASGWSTQFFSSGGRADSPTDGVLRACITWAKIQL